MRTQMTNSDLHQSIHQQYDRDAAWSVSLGVSPSARIMPVQDADTVSQAHRKIWAHQECYALIPDGILGVMKVTQVPSARLPLKDRPGPSPTSVKSRQWSPFPLSASNRRERHWGVQTFSLTIDVLCQGDRQWGEMSILINQNLFYLTSLSSAPRSSWSLTAETTKGLKFFSRSISPACRYVLICFRAPSAASWFTTC